MRCIAKFFAQKHGNTAVFFALALMPVVVIIGGSLDMSRASNAKQELQYALDAAVLAAARSDQSDFQKDARQFFSSNTVHLNHTAPKATFSSSKEDSATIYSGRATAKVPTIMSDLVGFQSFSVTVNSEVILESEDTGGPCIYLLDRQKNSALRVNSGADIEALECELHVHSTSNYAASFNAGMDIEFKRICIKGSGTLDNHRNVPNVELECDPDPDPYEGKIPEPSASICDVSNMNINGGSHTLTPGVYCGWTNLNNRPDITFEPGLYIIKNGGWNVNGGHWEGDGVTFYFHDTSKIQFNSAVSADLTPPTSGDYKNIIIAEKEGLNKSDFILNDSEDFQIEGVIHLPSRNTTYNSGSQIYSRKLTMVFNSMILNETKWTLTGAEFTSGNSVAALEPRIRK